MPAIGAVNISNPLVLAPMANVLKFPLRLAFKEMGFGLTAVGSIWADAIASRNDTALINLIGKEDFTDQRESPVMVQLIGSDPEMMARAAERIESRCDIIDLNFGCSVGWVRKKGWGSALLDNRILLHDIIAAVVRRVRVPVTAKVRVMDKAEKMFDIVRCCQDAGAAAITVHTRTVGQQFQGKAQWSMLPMIRAAIDIPLIGNGGVSTYGDVQVLLKDFGCDFVMVGLGAFRDPVAFQARISGERRKSLLDFAQLIAGQPCQKYRDKYLALAHFLITRQRVYSYVQRGFWL
jgi:tRNA-dihydrouridine synthase